MPVSEAITKVEDILRKDTAFAKGLRILAENLIKGRKRKYRITEAWPYSDYDPTWLLEFINDLLAGQFS